MIVSKITYWPVLSLISITLLCSCQPLGIGQKNKTAHYPNHLSEKEVRKRIGIGDSGTIDTMPGGFLTSKKRAGYLRWLAGIEEGSIHLIEENGHISYGWDDDYQGDLWPNARIMKTILGEADTQLDITDKRYNEKIISEKEYSLTSEEVYERNTE